MADGVIKVGQQKAMANVGHAILFPVFAYCIIGVIYTCVMCTQLPLIS